MPLVTHNDSRRLIERSKRRIAAGALVALGAVWWLASGHVVGVTAAQQSASVSAATPAPTQNFFDNANSFGSVGAGGGVPVMRGGTS